MTAAADKRLDSHWRLLFPSKYLGVADLRGKDLTRRIKTLTQEDLPVVGTKEKKAAFIASFHEPDTKPLILNSTNMSLIAEVHGPYVVDWIGKPITMFATTKEADGKAIKNPKTRKVVEAIRIRTPKPAGGRAAAEYDDATDSDSPADEPKEQIA